MKFIAPLVLVAATVFAQDPEGGSMPPAAETDMPQAAGTAMPPAAETTAAPAATGQPEPPMAQPMAQPMPDMPMLGGLDRGSESTQSLLARLASYFDMTHVASDVTSMPAFMANVFDPATGKFTFLSSSVMQTGDAYYVPVCPVGVIAEAGATPVAMQNANACGQGIQLTPMPSNVAATLLRAVRAKFRAILSAARPSFWHSRPGLFAGSMGRRPQQMMPSPEYM